jgi:hypothetical protein
MHAPEREYRVEDVNMADVVAFEALPDDARLLACKMHALWLDSVEIDQIDRLTELDVARNEGYNAALSSVADFIEHAMR